MTEDLKTPILSRRCWKCEFCKGKFLLGHCILPKDKDPKSYCFIVKEKIKGN